MTSKRQLWHLAGWLSVAVLAATLPAQAQEILAIRGATVYPVTGEPIENATIVVRDGRIEAVGTDVDIPVDARVLDGSGKVVIPGLIDVHTSGSIRSSNETNPISPFISVVDGIDPSNTFFEECRRNGVTCAGVFPGNRTMLGGQAAIVKTAGGYVDDMLVQRYAGLKISLQPVSGASRMSHYARLRRELESIRHQNEQDAEEAAAAAEDDTDDDDEEEEEVDEEAEARRASSAEAAQRAKREVLQLLLDGNLPAYIYCANAMDVAQALRLTNDFELETVLVLGRDAYEAAEAIAESGLPVILDPQLVFWKSDPRTDDEERIIVPRVFADHDIPVTFQIGTSSDGSLGTNYHWYQAATAVKYGMSEPEALRSLTLRPAEILGIAERVGSIEAGKDGDLVILSGPPLQNGTWVETTIVDGKVVYQRDQDERLRLLLEPETR